MYKHKVLAGISIQLGEDAGGHCVASMTK